MVEPLKNKTMTLNDLQMATINLIRRCRFQFGRQGHEPGMSDQEFIERYLDTLEATIFQDREILKMYRQQKRDQKMSQE